MGIEDLNLDLTEHADRVLLLTDSTEAQQTISSALEKRAYQWTHVATFEEALDLVKKELFDLVLVDYRGIETAAYFERINSSSEIRRCPLVFICPDASQIDREEAGIRVGGDIEVLQAPVKPSDVLVKLSILLRLRKRQSNDSRLETKILSQNAKLRDLTNRFKRELKEAEVIQQSIMPNSLPSDPGCIFAAIYIPLEAVGGDLYDIWKIGDNTYGAFIGDVTGHGLPAAFLGAMTKMALSYAPKENAGEMLVSMNDGMAAHMPDGRFVTAAAAIYHSDTGKLSIARAGHPPAYIWRAESKTVELAEPGGLPLGIMPDMEYDVFETELKVGDKMLMITDGIIETADMNGVMIGIDGVTEYFAKIAGEHKLADCLKMILDFQDEFCDGRILKDDNTLIAIERRA